MLPDDAGFDKLLNHLGFIHFPRSVGNPRQQFVFTSEDALRNLKKWEGDSSCFISTQGYDNLVFDAGGKQLPASIIYGLTFFDFDHDTKPENAYADAHRLSQFLTDNDIAHWVAYSGSKGYHLHIIHRPVRFKFSHRNGSAEALRQLVWQVQNHLKISLGLNTLDAQTMGDPKRLCRVPFTAHVNRHGELSGKYCFPISAAKLAETSHDQLESEAYRPQYHLPEVPGRRLTLSELIGVLGVSLEAPETQIRPVIGGEFGFQDTGSATARFVSALDVKCMGVVNELKRVNPAHKARVHAALFAKFLGMDAEQFESVWLEMGGQVGYVDLANTEYRKFQMASIFNNEKMRSFPNCSTLKRDGCCVGDVCPKFKTAEQLMKTQPQIRRKWRKKDA